MTVAARRNPLRAQGGVRINWSLLRASSRLRSGSAITILPGRLAELILFMAALFIAGLVVAAPTSTARAKECLAAPSSPAPEGSWWYYRLDWPTQRKCWYLRSLGKPAQQTNDEAKTGPVRSRSAPSESIRPTDRARKPTSPDDTAPSPPDSEKAPVGSIAPEVPAPQVSPLTQTNTPNTAPELNAPPVVSPSSQPIVEQNGHEEITTQSIPERPVQGTSAPSQTNAEAAAPVDAAGVASPDVVPRIKALESGEVPTDASTPDYIETVARSREQAKRYQIPMILLLVIPVGLWSAFFIFAHIFSPNPWGGTKSK